MSEENNGYPKVQLSTFIQGDQFVFRSETGEQLKDTVTSVAENGDDTIKALNSLKQLGVANGIFTGDSSKGGGSKSGGAATRAPDTAPPGGDSPTCKHGPMKDLAGKGYKNRWYCPERDRANQCKPLP